MAVEVRKTYDSAQETWRVDVVEIVADSASVAYTFPLTEQDADWLVAALRRRRALLVSPASLTRHVVKGTLHEVVGRPEGLYRHIT